MLMLVSPAVGHRQGECQVGDIHRIGSHMVTFCAAVLVIVRHFGSAEEDYDYSSEPEYCVFPNLCDRI